MSSCNLMMNFNKMNLIQNNSNCVVNNTNNRNF